MNAMRVGLTFRYPRKVLSYESAIRMVGLEPVRINPVARRTIDGLSGLVVTGGSDINPARYGQVPEPTTGQPDEERDEIEILLAAEALRIGLPVLGICRGMQILNVARGGTLIQHLATGIVHTRPSDDQDKPGRHAAAHAIEVTSGSRLAAIVGTGRYDVNSRHHQAIDRIGEGLVACALADDGTVEGFERKDRSFFIGVQWHPEDRIEISPQDRRLFEAFAAAVSEVRP